MDEAGVVHVMLEWLKVCNTKAMEVIERSMDEAGAVHVMLECLKVCNTLVPCTFNHYNITCTAPASSILLSITSIALVLHTFIHCNIRY
jgi:hypothetical protein